MHYFLDEHRILSPFQHGFRKGLLPSLNLFPLFISTSVLDKAGQVIFLDFHKMFDCVPHDKLNNKLQVTGLPHCLIAWVSAYLIKGP